jgi:hypothetical protein
LTIDTYSYRCIYTIPCHNFGVKENRKNPAARFATAFDLIPRLSRIPPQDPAVAAVRESLQGQRGIRASWATVQIRVAGSACGSWWDKVAGRVVEDQDPVLV